MFTCRIFIFFSILNAMCDEKKKVSDKKNFFFYYFYLLLFIAFRSTHKKIEVFATFFLLITLAFGSLRYILTGWVSSWLSDYMVCKKI